MVRRDGGAYVVRRAHADGTQGPERLFNPLELRLLVDQAHACWHSHARCGPLAGVLPNFPASALPPTASARSASVCVSVDWRDESGNSNSTR